MISKTILAVAAAAVLSAGAMAVSTSAADAHYAGGYYQTYCKTAYHTILVGYDYYNQPIYKSVPYQYCDKVFVPYTNYSYSAPSYGYSYHYGY
jgi:hypothetical protein